MCRAHQHEEYGWLDVLDHLVYAEDEYGGEITVTLAVDSAAEQNAVLLVDGTVMCRCMGYHRFHVCTTREVSRKRMRKLPEEVRDALYEAEDHWIENLREAGCACFGGAKVIE